MLKLLSLSFTYKIPFLIGIKLVTNLSIYAFLKNRPFTIRSRSLSVNERDPILTYNLLMHFYITDIHSLAIEGNVLFLFPNTCESTSLD